MDIPPDKTQAGGGGSGATDIITKKATESHSLPQHNGNRISPHTQQSPPPLSSPTQSTVPDLANTILPTTEQSQLKPKKSRYAKVASKFVKRSTAPYQNLDDINDEEEDDDADLQSSASVSQFVSMAESEIGTVVDSNDRESTPSDTTHSVHTVQSVMSSKSRRSSRSKKSIQQTISERFAQIQGTPKTKISKKTSAQILVEEDEENESEDEYLEEAPEKLESIKNNSLTDPGVPKNNSNSPCSSPQNSNQHDLNQTLTTIVSPIRETKHPDDVNSGVNFEAGLNADFNAELKSDFNTESGADVDANVDALSTGGASTGAASVRSYNSKASSIKSIKNNVKHVVASFTNPLDSNSSNRKSSKSSKSSNSVNSPKIDIISVSNKTSSKQPKLPAKPKGILKKSREPQPARNDQMINTQNQYQPDSILAESNLERNRSRSTWSFASQSNSAYADSQVYEGKWWNHRKVQDNLKFVFTFVFLIVLGMILLITGLALIGSGKPFAGHFILIVMGLLFVIPACYYLFALYATVKGISGFRFYNLPLFN